MSNIRGPFPFPTAQINEGGGVIELSSGSAWYATPGEYLITCGGQTLAQWFDPINQIWRTLGTPGTQTDFFPVDGYNYRLINMSGTVQGAQITAAGTGATTNGVGFTATGVSVSFGAAPTNGRAATGYAIIGGSVQAPTIAQAGSGFLVPPLIVIDPPAPGGIQATAVATISAAGAVTAITMTNVGGGYAASPNFWVLPQTQYYQGGPQGGNAAGNILVPGLVFPANAAPGNQNTSSTGVQLTSLALTGSGTLTGIGMLDYGGNYTGTQIPTVTVTGGSISGATATALMSLALTSVTLGAGGSGYGTTGPIFETSLGLVLGTNNNNQLGVRAARGTAAVGGGIVTTFTVEDAGYGFQSVPRVAVIATSAVATVQATGTAVCGGVNDVSIVQPRVQ